MNFTFLESNFLPSVTIVTPPDQGVQSRLSSQANVQPQYDGVKLDELWANRDISHYDPIDRLGVVSKRLQERMSNYEKSAFHRDFTQALLRKDKK